jgi:hypothetical protein
MQPCFVLRQYQEIHLREFVVETVIKGYFQIMYS